MNSTDNTSRLAELKDLAAKVSNRVHKIALLYGGTSGEREVSISSGTSVKAVLEEEGFDVMFIDTGKEGFVDELLTGKPDVAFIALHGKGGEDGCIQGFLETLGIPYTQSGIESSAIAMDKRISKILYELNGLDTAEYLELQKDKKPEKQDLDTIVNQLGLPCVVKPSCDGSSLGVSIPKTRQELEEAIELGFQIGDLLLIERFIKGVEVTIPVLGNEPKDLLPLSVIEIVPKNEFYDYESKYAEGGSTHIIPARLEDAKIKRCQQAAVDAHIALGCSGLSRTDIIVSDDGIPWLIETNTVPGMTHTSLIPDSARHFGFTDGELYRLLLHYALERDM